MNSQELLKTEGEAGLVRRVSRSEVAMLALQAAAESQVMQELYPAPLSQEEKEILDAPRGAGEFTPEVAAVTPGAREHGEGALHFTVSVIDHPLGLHDLREVPVSFSLEEIIALVPEVD